MSPVIVIFLPHPPIPFLNQGVTPNPKPAILAFRPSDPLGFWKVSTVTGLVGLGVAIFVIVVAVTLGASWAIHASKKKRVMSSSCCRKGQLCGPFCLPIWRAAPPTTPAHDVIKMFAGTECCADHFVGDWGGLRHPNPPAVLKAYPCFQKDLMSSTCFQLQERKVARIILFATPPAVLKPSMLPIRSIMSSPCLQ